MIRLLLIPCYVMVLNFFGSIQFTLLAELVFLITLSLFLDFVVPGYFEVESWDQRFVLTNEFKKIKLLDILNVVANMSIYMGSKILLYHSVDIQPFTFSDQQLLIKLFVSWITSSIWFYCSHLLLHHKSMYHLIHKQHHLFTNPLAIMAIYAHIVEFIICNCISMILIHYLIDLPRDLILAYSFVGMVNVLITHTSYRIKNPFLRLGFGDSRFHYIHHEKFKYNYGLNSRFMDIGFSTLFVDKVIDKN